MDIYSANNAIKRILSFVEAYSESNSAMYEKSKLRYQELLDNCEKAAELLSKCLSSPHKRGESLTCDDTTIDVQPECIDTDPVNSISGHFDECMEPVDSTQPVEISEYLDVDKDTPTVLELNTNELASTDVNPVVDTVPTESSPGNRRSSRDRSKKYNKGILRKYACMFRKLKNVHTDYVYANECISLLCDWFDARFSGADPNFRYNIRMISKWIQDIVIVYGNHLHDHTQDTLAANMRSWANSIRNSKESSKYAIPYEIYYGSQHYDQSGITLTAVVLWDIIYDAGLKDVCDPSDPMYPNEESVYRLCDKISPDSLDFYGPYTCNPNVLIRSSIS